ncbi:MAG: hypothetical protein ABIN89_24580 [Chitinophagaceae bacterium]
MSFEKNVFINCPFDEDYKLLLKPILFTIIQCGLHPKIAESEDSGEARIKRIEKLIEESQYSIHDLSRMRASSKGEIARFNMPFELGLDFGCKRFKGGEHSNKKSLILDFSKYRYQKAISDISGNDIGFHNSRPENAIRELRNWLQKLNHSQKFPSANKMWMDYLEFNDVFLEIMKTQHFNKEDVKKMPWSEFINYIFEWYEARKKV